MIIVAYTMRSAPMNKHGQRVNILEMSFLSIPRILLINTTCLLHHLSVLIITGSQFC